MISGKQLGLKNKRQQTDKAKALRDQVIGNQRPNG